MWALGVTFWEMLTFGMIPFFLQARDGDVIAHVFTPTARTYYDLEDLYQECDEVELPFETERMHDGFYAEEDQEFYENEDEDESEDLEDEFEINWSEK